MTLNKYTFRIQIRTRCVATVLAYENIRSLSIPITTHALDEVTEASGTGLTCQSSRKVGHKFVGTHVRPGSGDVTLKFTMS